MSAKAYYHLPGLFEFYEFYRAFLPLYRANRDWFYDWCEIGSIYGAPADCLWGGGRAGFGECGAREALALAQEYGVSARLTFSNSLLREEHLSDRKCNALCELFSQANGVQNGVIVHSELLTDYLRARYPALYLVSSTTKVLTDFDDFRHELDREEFRYVVPDFRLNKRFEELNALSQVHKDKVEFLCNECCWFGCSDRKQCYEVVSRKISARTVSTGVKHRMHRAAIGSQRRWKIRGSSALMLFCGRICQMGFSQFKIEGRGLGSALILEFCCII